MEASLGIVGLNEPQCSKEHERARRTRAGLPAHGETEVMRTKQAAHSHNATQNPKLETILALADVLSVDPEYFVSPGALGRLRATHSGQYAALEADPHIVFVSRRMGQMTPEDKAIIVAIVQRLTGEPATTDRASEPLEVSVVAQMRQDMR